MRKLMKTLSVPVLSTVLLFMALSTIASASDNRPGRRRPGHGGGYSVAEPAAVVLLGAGLVSLGLYAKRKRSKKQ